MTKNGLCNLQAGVQACLPRNAKAVLAAAPLSVLGALLCSPLTVQSASEVYVCTDSTGARVYQNTSPSDQCRRLNLEPVLTVPQPGNRSQGVGGNANATYPPAGGAQGVGGMQGSATRRQGGQGASPGLQGGGNSEAATTHPGASVTSRESLQARESDRLRILESELREEERRLQGLVARQQSAPDERLTQDIARSQASLDALRREIGKVRRP